MKLAELQDSVNAGSCTWLQVRETLINSRTSHHTRRLYLQGEIDLGPYADAMLRELVSSGGVPLRPPTRTTTSLV
ncbi:MAG TPA: hypothetical protein VN650_10060 [Gemmatimonadaceae bacterium]|nr:hypothetical protein [Gemmatimonadaceae bacterium]